MVFVRIYDMKKILMERGGFMRFKDINRLTAKQIQNKFALKETLKYITEVHLKK